MLLKANQLTDKKMSNVEVKQGTSSYSTVFVNNPKVMKLAMPAIPENEGPMVVTAPTTETLN